MILTISVQHRPTPTLRRPGIAAARTAAARAAAAHVLDTATNTSPKQTGRLAAGFRDAAVATTHAADTTTAHATNTVRYAGYVEAGTRKMAARRMLRRAIRHALPAVERIVARALLAR